MKIDKLQKTVDFWRTEDGLDFDTYEKAENYAKRTEGTRRDCPGCKGLGVSLGVQCPECGGKGYQDKVEQWT